jgi:hypothetical protein
VDLKLIAHGDCGTWVVDSVTGDLYGQIVAGCPGSGVAYIFPAKHIQRDIWRVSGSCPLLPPKTFRQLRQDNRLTFPSESVEMDHSNQSQSLATHVRGSSVGRALPHDFKPEGWLESIRKPQAPEYLNTTLNTDVRGASNAHPSPPLFGHLVDAIDPPTQLHLRALPTTHPRVSYTLHRHRPEPVIPPDAQWTKVRRGLICTEVLDQDRQQYKV